MPGNRYFGVISDIHGNTDALEAVLADIDSRNIDTILNLGDSLYGPIDPAGTYNLIRKRGMISISGNEDRMIIEDAGKGTGNPTLSYVRGELGPEALEWLEGIPFDGVFEGTFYCCHGTPSDDTVYLIEELNPAFVGIKNNDILDDLVRANGPAIVLCGHSHVPRLIWTGTHTIVNPGSVGLQAYDDDIPVFHVMESGNPLAKYTVLTLSGKTLLKVEQVALPYDFERAARKAEKNGRPDWAKWIRTGKAR